MSGFHVAVRPRTALVVVDDDTLRLALADQLDDDGFEVMTAITLHRARYILFESRHPVGVLVLDHALRDGDGRVLVEALCARDDTTTALVLIGGGGSDDLGQRYGVACLRRPIDLDVASAAVRVAFESGVSPRRMAR